MLNAIALLLASSTSVKFQMLPHETIEDQFRIVVSPLLEGKENKIEVSKSVTETGKAASEIKNSLIIPFTITGTVEYIEEQLPIALAAMNEPRIEAKNNLDTLMKSLNKVNTSKVTTKNKAKVTPTVKKADVVNKTDNVVVKQVAKTVADPKEVKDSKAISASIPSESKTTPNQVTMF